MEKESEMKAILVLHFFCQEQYVGQDIMWVKVSDSNVLGTLLYLLSEGKRPESLQGTDRYPRQSLGWKELRLYLERAFVDYPFQHFVPQDQNYTWKIYCRVRVAQVIPGWPFPEPRYS